MSTVPKADTPPPANNAKTLTLQSDENLYVRPTAGGNRSGQASGPLGTAPDAPPAGNVPANPIKDSLSGAVNDPSYQMANPGADPSVGGTQTGPNFGHGATQIVAQPDATGHPAGDISGGGTVGNSGKGLGQ